jgi:hypothetical protein
MTSLLQLEEELRAIDADPGVRLHRQTMKRRRPDLSNRSDTDVLEWTQRVEDNAREFFEAYAQHRNCRGYDEYAEEMVDLMKRLIIVWQDAQGRQEEIDGL